MSFAYNNMTRVMLPRPGKAYVKKTYWHLSLSSATLPRQALVSVSIAKRLCVYGYSLYLGEGLCVCLFASHEAPQCKASVYTKQPSNSDDRLDCTHKAHHSQRKSRLYSRFHRGRINIYILFFQSIIYLAYILA